MKAKAVQGKQVPVEWTEDLGESQNGGTTLRSSPLSFGERLLLRCDGNAGNSFPTDQGKDRSSRATAGNGDPLDLGGTLVLPLECRRVCRGTS